MTMEEATVKEEVPNVDFTKVAPLQQKRTIAFVNHFLTTTSQFLNNFLYKCEQKLMQFERKLEKVEAAMILLETRLASIPEANTEEFDNTKEESNQSMDQSKEVENQGDVSQKESNSETEQTVQENVKEKETVVQSQPEYERFVKMVQVGVPLEAVKLKVSIEGLDPNVLEKILKK